MGFVLVFCHTLFNDAFRNYPDTTPLKLKEQKSAQFIIRYFIETKGDDSKTLAITSEQVMESLESNFPRQGINLNFNETDIRFRPAQMILALRNLLIVFDGGVKNIGESITIISDIASSRIGTTKLISNMSNKKRDIIEFYQAYSQSSKKIKDENIPFEVMTTCELEDYLRRGEQLICETIDKRIRGEL